MIGVSGATVFLWGLGKNLGVGFKEWQFLTPVLYPLDQVPKEVEWIFMANPMTNVIVSYRDILYYERMPQLGTLLSATVVGMVLLAAGWLLFDRLQKRFAEEL